MAGQPIDDILEPWAARKLDGVWCVGTEGNLDTIHDATVRVTGGWLSPEAAQAVAESIVRQHNGALPGRARA